MGEGNNTGTDIYSALRAKEATLTIQPIYNHVVRLQQAFSDDMITGRVVAKYFIGHSGAYKKPVFEEFAGTSLAKNDEPLFLIAGLEQLVRQARKDPDTIEEFVVTPSQATQILASTPTLSVFWHNLSQLYEQLPEYHTSNDRLRDLGLLIIETLRSVDRVQRPVPSVNFTTDSIDDIKKGFNQPVFRYLRLEMRRANEAIGRLLPLPPQPTADTTIVARDAYD